VNGGGPARYDEAAGRALEIILDDEAFRHMDKASAVPLGQPHDLIASMWPRLLGDGPAGVPAPAIPVA